MGRLVFANEGITKVNLILKILELKDSFIFVNLEQKKKSNSKGSFYILIHDIFGVINFESGKVFAKK